MEANRGVLSVAVITSVFVVSVVVIFMVSGGFTGFMSFSSSKSEYSLPIVVELQTKITSSDEVRAVLSRRSTPFYGNRLINQTVIREDQELEEGLARAHALIRKAGLSRRSTRFSVNRLINQTVIREDQELEEGLARARALIRKAGSNHHNHSSSTVDDDDESGVYRNPGAFYQSYLEMERRFKVYVYEEGDPPIVHDGPCKNIYTTEGRFIHEMEHGGGRFRTRDAHRAHVYFMPFSVTWMVKYIYKPNTYNLTPLRRFVSDYVRVISTKYPFWNRTQGADHFMLACHDWGPHASQGNPHIYNTSIRVLCNANTSEGFNPQKDVSLPEIHLYDGNISPKLLSVPPAESPRPYLAFFAGGVHGPIRPILLQHWKGRDDDLRVYEYLPKDLDYYSFMLQSKFCLCPSGHEVASPRVVEAIYAECVPVILSDHYVLPFSDVLRWEAFSIRVEISEIPRLKEVLRSISEEKYMRLKKGLRAVRRHFVLNQPAKRFDVFHMILHSVWLRRINVRLG